MIVCAGRIEQFDFARPVGIGMIESAITLTQLCIEEKPEEILFVGTAGAYGKHRVFDIVSSHTAANIEQSFFEGNAYSPIADVLDGISCDGTEKVLSKVSRETKNAVIVNSSNYITTNRALWEHYTARNIYLENMEFFGVVQVAKQCGIPVAGLFIVTNYCDENAHRDFVKNHQEAMERLTEYVEKLEIRN